MRGDRNAACGHAFRARAIGIAERTPKTARLVARGADHAPVAEAADDDRPAAQARVVELLDRGEERVEVDVQDRSRPAASGRARASGRDVVHDGARTTRMSSRVVPNTS